MNEKSIIKMQNTTIKVLNRQVVYLEGAIKVQEETINNLIWGLQQMGDKYCFLLDFLAEQHSPRYSRATEKEK